MARGTYMDDESSGDGWTIGGILKVVGGVILGIVVIFSLFGSWFTIGQKERGVLTCNGAVCGVVEPGLHFKLPLVQGIEYVSIQPQKASYGGNDAPFSAYSADQQPANLHLSVNFHVIDPQALYSNYSNIDNAQGVVLDPRVRQAVKQVFGRFNAVEAIQDRAKLEAQANEVIKSLVNTQGSAILVDSVQIEDIAFSDTYEKAVEARMEATVRQQQAQAEAAATRTRADASAYAVTAAGNAQATAIRARGDALKDNPALPSLVTAERWDGHLPTTMVPGNATPFINVHPVTSGGAQ